MFDLVCEKKEIDVLKQQIDVSILGLGRRGYDVIQDKFFIELTSNNFGKKVVFDTFNDYFNFVNGAIYDNACYYHLDKSRIDVDVDFDKLFSKKAFINETIDKYCYESIDKHEFDKGEKRKKLFSRWLDKLNVCLSEKDFIRTVDSLKMSSFYHEITTKAASLYKSNKISYQASIKYEYLFFWDYIYRDLNSKERFNYVMSYFSNLSCCSSIVRELCVVYNPNDVFYAYCYDWSYYRGHNKQKERLKSFIKAIEDGLIRFKEKVGYFDNLTHYYCEETIYEILYGKNTSTQNMGATFSTYRVFDNFESFVEYRKGDLTNCDFSYDIPRDFSSYKTDDSTKLHVNSLPVEDYVVKKYFRDDRFFIRQIWKKDNSVLKIENYEFDYFCDFVYFLKGDLSRSDLISCDGLKNLKNISDLNLDMAMIPSAICVKLGIPVDKYLLTGPKEYTFPNVEKIEQLNTLANSGESFLENVNNGLIDDRFCDKWLLKIYYISDIHFYSLLKNKKVVSKSDVIRVIRDVVKTIKSESIFGRYILIAGDVSLDFNVFKQFVIELYKEIDSSKNIIFTLGNHDIWSRPKDTFPQIVEAYRSLLSEHGMYLLQNNVLFQTYGSEINQISERELETIDCCTLRDKVRRAQIIFFGGVGFSGYNEEFNALSGIYRYNETIGFDRNFEINETKKFEELYNKISVAFEGKNVVVLTHMGLADWRKSCADFDLKDNASYNTFLNQGYNRGFVYVSGHTHKNYFYDDGDFRILADNQFGYNINRPTAVPHLKFFEIGKNYDYFSDYKDGIYEISVEEYKEFYYGKGLSMSFNRETNVLYMLKKSGYYCFIHKSKNNQLGILNGGNIKNLDNKNIEYYFYKMDDVVSLIKKPLDEYTEYQKYFAEQVKQIGGTGNIHGCIIDIDFFNHIYINPIDGSLIGYWAFDIVRKVIYPTIPALLERECPNLYSNYIKIIETEKNDFSLTPNVLNEFGLLPKIYLDTDIYSVSREIKKMQKLNSNILSSWVERAKDVNLFIEDGKENLI